LKQLNSRTMALKSLCSLFLKRVGLLLRGFLCY
jgi:hypothetical protein